MDEKTKDVKEEEVVETSETSSVEENPTEEVNDEEVETETKTEETEPEETETGDSSKGANQRIRELNAKAKAAEAKAQSLAQRVEELTGSNEPEGQPYKSSIEPGSEISPEQYRQDVARQADSIVSLRLKQQEAVGRIRSETSDAVRKYPELDPESEHFNKELSDTVYDAVDAVITKNPYSAPVSQFIDRLMKPYHQAVETESGKASENLAKQASQTALKPTQNRTEEKNDSDLSIAELEAKYGVTNT